jgi:DUF1680 family protein
MGGEVEHQFQENKVNFHITSEFPWEGNVEIVANMETDSEYTLALRIPEWCSFYTLNGVEGIHEGSKKWGDGSMKVESGYLYLTKKWSDGEKLQLDFIMDIRLMQSNSLVRENEGCLAVTRGPIVYCMEEKDNGTNLHQVYLDTNKEGVAEKWNELGEVMRKVVLKGVRYEESQPVKELYAPMKGRKSKEVDITLIPYYAWANRGEGEMRVWIRR